MEFSKFLSEYDTLINEVAKLLTEAGYYQQDRGENDTVNFNPNDVKQYAGTAVTRTLPQLDPSRTQSVPKLTAKPNRGDIVFLQTANGYVPAMITMNDGHEVSITNKGRTMNAKRPVSELRPAPANIMTKFPGRNGWMIVSSAASTLV